MKKHYLLIFLVLLTFNCAKTDPMTGERIIIEPDPVKKARDAAVRSGGFFGDIGGQKSSNQTVNFGNANVLWRATLKSLDFLPLISSDYSGGILIYDWYSENNNSKEQIKISIQFLSNELRSDSIKITAHKRICENIDKCSNLIVDQKFADTVKENIITVARSLKIEEAKKEKK
jgi:hypothetical protein